MYDPLQHFDELVMTNIDGGVLMHHPVPAAAFFHPETLTYWLKVDGAYQQVSQDMAYVQNLWLTFTYGAPMYAWRDEALDLIGLSHDYNGTPDAMRAAVMQMPVVLQTIRDGGYTEQQVWDYAVHEAVPGIVLVGVP